MDLASYGTFLNEKATLSATAHRSHHRRRHCGNHHRQHPTTSPFDLAEWMRPLPDTTPLSSLTMPGTHDSAAYDVIWPFVATQTMDVTDQLLSGVRYLDLRVGLVDNALEMVHGRALLGRPLSLVLTAVYGFLAAHPSEALVVQIKQDRAPEASDVPFDEALWDLLLSPDGEGGGTAGFWVLGGSTPVLGEVRGRIQLLRRFVSRWRPGGTGIDVSRWIDNPSRPFIIRVRAGTELVVQDHYNPDTPRALPDFVEGKSQDVLGMLELAAGDGVKERWFLNFVSAYEFNLYWQASPHDVAVGGWWYYRWIEGVNVSVMEWLESRNKGVRERLGIVILDYPTMPDANLMRSLVETNFGPEKQSNKVSARAVVIMAVVLLLIFIGGSLLVLIHGPSDRAYCPPHLHACVPRRLHGWSTDTG